MVNFSKQSYSGSDELQKLFEKYAKTLELPAKTILLEEGKTAKKCYFIEKGCIRAWFHNILTIVIAGLLFNPHLCKKTV